MLVSASQLKTYKRCPRLWWFEKVRRMPASSSKVYGIIFGNVLHSTLERWLSADPSGRDPYGDPVEVYPDGWTWDMENMQEITKEDQELIPQLIQQAVEEGILQRLPGQQIEKRFTVPLTGTGIFITGAIDVAAPQRVIDHKGVKSRRWALSPAKLLDDDQMLLYGKIQNITGSSVRLSHNQFFRTDPTGVRQTTVSADPSVLDARWKECGNRAEKMRVLREQHTQDYSWRDVPANVGDACNMYGGCRFLSICTNQETPPQFRKRYLKIALQEKDMSLEEKIRGKKPPVPQTSINPSSDGVSDSSTSTSPPLLVPAGNVDPCLLHGQKDGKAQGLVILRNAAIIHGESASGHLATISDVLKHAVTEVGGTSMKHFYAKNSFERKDALAAGVDEILASLLEGGELLYLHVPSSITPDEKALLSALAPHATMEIAGCL